MLGIYNVGYDDLKTKAINITVYTNYPGIVNTRSNIYYTEILNIFLNHL